MKYHRPMAKEIRGPVTHKTILCLCGHCSSIIFVDFKTYATADPYLHAINKITKEQDLLRDPLVLTPHDSVECTGEDFFLVRLDLIQEGVDGGKGLGVPFLGF